MNYTVGDMIYMRSPRAGPFKIVGLTYDWKEEFEYVSHCALRTRAGVVDISVKNLAYEPEIVAEALTKKERPVPLQPAEKINEVLDVLELLNNEGCINDWEYRFMCDMRYRHPDDLSQKQLDVLDKIYLKACDSPF